MTTAIAQLQAQLTQLAAAQQAAQRATFNGGVMDSPAYRRNLQRMADIRRSLIDQANASGAFQTRSVNLASATDAFNESLANNKLRMRDVVKEMRVWNKEQGLARRAYREQLALQQSAVADWGADNRGRRMGTLFVPNEIPRALESWRSQMGYINKMIGSAAENTVKWGKNTQWAGRQLMVGFTYPIALIGAGTAALAYQYEKEMSRIIKVSDDANAQIRLDARKTAEYVASQYGISAIDTLRVQGELAAVGYSGNQLQSMTQTTQRGAFLGELDQETAIKATTTLQTIYKMNNKELDKAYNYINAIENATSLTMQDFAVSIPRVASLSKALGVNLQELGVLMVGFKSAGIDPEEGARALRSISFRTIAPKGHVIEIFNKNTGKDLKAIVAEYKGEFLPTFIRIAEEIKGLEQIEQIEIIRNLFGLEQGNKALLLMQQLTEGSDQMARAWDVASQSPEQWAASAEKETKDFQENVANRFKMALEVMRLELIDIGTPFLEFGTKVLESLKPIFDFFQRAPKWVKGFAAAMMLVGLALGPIIMLAGLTANAFGSLVKGAIAITGVRNQFKLMNVEQRASALLAENSARANQTQAITVDQLRQRMDALTASIRAQSLAMSGLNSSSAGAMAAASMMGRGGPAVNMVHPTRPLMGPPGGVSLLHPNRPMGNYSRTANGAWRNTQTNRFVSRAEVENAQRFQAATVQAANSTGAIAGNSASTARSWGMGASSMVTAAAAAAMIATSTGDATANEMQITQTLFGLSLAATLLPGLVKGAWSLGGALGRSLPITRGLTNNIGAAVGRMGAFGAGAVRFLGPIGVIAGGVLLLKEVYDWMTLIENRQNDIAESGERWAEILGYTYDANALAVDEQKDVLTNVQQLDKATSALRDKNKGLVDYTRSQKDNQAELLRIAQQQAALVATSGGTKDQAKIAAKSVLMAADVSEAQIESIMIGVDRIDWENPQAVANSMASNFSSYLNNAISAQARGGFSFRDIFKGKEDLSQEAGEQAKLAGQAFAEQFKAGAGDAAAQLDMLEGLDKKLERDTDDILTDLRNSSPEIRKLMEEMSISGPQALISRLRFEEGKAAEGVAANKLDEFGYKLSNTIKLTDQQRTALEEQAAMEIALVQAIAKNLNIEDERAGKLRTIEGLINLLGVGSDELKDALNNESDALRNVAASASVAATGMEWLQNVSEETAATMLPDARKSAMQYAADYILDQAAFAHQNNFDSAMAGLRARGEAEAAALDKDADAIDDKYKRAARRLRDSWEDENSVKNARLRGIRDQIKAEEAAERVRERIFEAEKRRIERLAALYSANVDFNTALNEGNLDDAAKIQANTNAQVAQWSIDDQRENTPEKTRLDMLKEAEAAEEAAVARQKEREEELLRAAEERERAEVEAAKKASQERIRDKEASAQRMFEIEKRRLDRELAILRQFIPSNEAELKIWEGKARAIYNEFGSGYLEPTSTAWGNLVGQGLEMGVRSSTEAMKNEIKWAEIAAAIAGQITSVLGLNVAQFTNWMKTGTFPGSAASVAAKLGGGAVMIGGTLAGGLARHTGGQVPWSSKDRTGIPRSAGLYPSETMAVLKRGEFVVNRRAAQKNLGLLHHINENKVHQEGQSLHTGGVVGMGGGAMAAGMMAGIMGAVARSIGQQLAMSVASELGMMGGGGSGAANALGAAALGAILKGLRMQESSGNYKARSKISSASGAYQYIKSTWGNYGGYREAWMAPPAIQDQRASSDLMRNFQKFGNWEQAIAAHFYPAWAGNRAKWGEAPGKGNPTVWDYVNGVLSKSGFGGMGLAGGGFTTSNGGWPPAVMGKVSANTAAAADYIRKRYGINNIGLLGWRPNKSDHPMGKAADFMIPNWSSSQGIALGDAISSFFIQNPNAFGTKYVIWRQRINQGKGWVPMEDRGSPTANHMDHPHVSFKHRGGEIPSLNIGGNILRDNVLANLHKGETVLTAPLSKTLEDGINNGGGGDHYSFDVTINGDVTPQTKAEFEKAIRTVLDERDKRNGNSRRQGR